MHEIIQYYTNIALIEWIAVVASIAYVVLASYNSIWCWPAAIVSTVLYTIIFYDFYLWSDSLLQVYYLAMALYGWSCWQPHTKENATLNGELANISEQLAITTRPWASHIVPVILLSVISLILGYFMANYTPTDFPYIDAATTTFAVYATYLLTQRVLENWLYWVVIDFVSIYLYVEKALLPTAFLFVIYVVLAAFGYFKWRKMLNTDISEAQTSSA